MRNLLKLKVQNSEVLKIQEMYIFFMSFQSMTILSTVVILQNWN